MSMRPELLPKEGMDGLTENWRNDVLSGFLVFLIALPLCLGIAIASGFPPGAGILTAIIGGLIVSRINGSYVTINGPAAGLIVVILDAVQTLGEGDTLAGYRYTLAAIMLAGTLQFFLGLNRAGQLSAYFPSAVVHGMLAAIGIIIIAKQSHVLLGVEPEPGGIFSTLLQIPSSLLHPNPHIAFIGLSGLVILWGWKHVQQPLLKQIPAPIVVVLVGMLLVQILDVQQTQAHSFLVNIPEHFGDFFALPDFSKLSTLAFWESVVAICLIGSLETLLSANAVDKLDLYQRQSDLDRDLAAVGFGNMVAGFIGGLPMIAEIVRSSANVDNGARTEWANFFHGLILLIFVVVFPGLVNSVPLASLAVLLVYTGFRLASPQSFKRVLTIGVEQFSLFTITIIAVLATDLLMGVVIGIGVKLAIHLARGVWLDNMFKIHFRIQQSEPNTVTVKLRGSALFSNFLPLKNALATLDAQHTIIFDFTEGYLIDHTVMEFIHEFSQRHSAQGGTCRIVGQALETFSDHALAARLMTPDDRKN